MTMTLHPVLAAVTDRIRQRSAATRADYLAHLEAARSKGPLRNALGCTQPRARFRRGTGRRQAHAAREPARRTWRSSRRTTTCCRRTSRSSASPRSSSGAAREAGATAQFAGGVPAMCDGVTQGEPGMELSLFSRDVIAHGHRGRAVAQHVRRRAVPGRVRQDRAGPADRRAAVRPPAGDLRARRSDDHRAVRTTRRRASASSSRRARSAATSCSNREATVVPRRRHLHLLRHRQQQPDADGGDGPAPAGRGVRQPQHAAARCADRGRGDAGGGDHRARRRVHADRPRRRRARDRQRASSALLATGGSTNHTIHLVAIARAAGIVINWDDFSDLSDVVPLLARVYPNGKADVNHFHAAGGMGFVIGELLDARTAARRRDHGGRRRGLRATARSRACTDGELAWRDCAAREPRSPACCDRLSDPFSADGGLKLLRRQPRARGHQDLGGQAPSTAWSRRRRSCSTTRRP